MKALIILLLCALVVTSCGSSENAASADFELGKESISLKLYYESYFNLDGMENRKISVEYPNGEIHEFDVHQAHYSDAIQLRKLEISNAAYLVAEDKTGYTVWDLKKKRKIVEQGMESNELVDEPEGTGRDYMTHKALSQAQWINILAIKKVSNFNMSEIKLD